MPCANRAAAATPVGTTIAPSARPLYPYTSTRTSRLVHLDRYITHAGSARPCIGRMPSAACRRGSRTARAEAPRRGRGLDAGACQRAIGTRMPCSAAEMAVSPLLPPRRSSRAKGMRTRVWMSRNRRLSPRAPPARRGPSERARRHRVARRGRHEERGQLGDCLDSPRACAAALSTLQRRRRFHVLEEEERPPRAVMWPRAARRPPIAPAARRPVMHELITPTPSAHRRVSRENRNALSARRQRSCTRTRVSGERAVDIARQTGERGVGAKGRCKERKRARLRCRDFVTAAEGGVEVGGFP